MPFAELVERVERLAGGAAAPRAGRRRRHPPAAPRAARRRPASPRPRRPPPRRGRRPAAPAPRPRRPRSTGLDRDLLGRHGALAAQARPSLAQPLRGAQAREEGDTLVLEVQPDFCRLAATHVDEYRDLARKACGRPRKVRIGAGRGAADAAAAALARRGASAGVPDEAVREPAVQEALDLFGGKVRRRARDQAVAKEGP